MSLWRQLFPTRVQAENQFDFFGPAPTLQLLLPSDGALDILKKFAVNKLVHFVLLTEALVYAVFVLPDAAGQIARHTDIKAAGVPAHDVNPSAFGNHWKKWMGPSTQARRTFTGKK